MVKARDIAWEWLAKIELDIDPHEEKRRADAERRAADVAARETMFEVVAERWFATIRGQARGREVEADFRREYVERFRGRAVGDVTKAEIRTMIETKAQRHPAQARNLC